MEWSELCKCISVILQKTRMRILELLKDRWMTIPELIDELKISRNLFAYHISILEHVGLLKKKYEVRDKKIVLLLSANKDRINEIINEFRERVLKRLEG